MALRSCHTILHTISVAVSLINKGIQQISVLEMYAAFIIWVPEDSHICSGQSFGMLVLFALQNSNDSVLSAG